MVHSSSFVAMCKNAFKEKTYRRIRIYFCTVKQVMFDILHMFK